MKPADSGKSGKKPRVFFHLANNGLSENATGIDVGRIVAGYLNPMPADLPCLSKDGLTLSRKEVCQDESQHRGAG